MLTESGGADLPRQAEIFVPGGEQFRRLTQLSAAGIPTVCVVFGSSTAGGAYLPGMSDYTIFVEGRARVFLGGPPLVKMAIDEDADEEELGGAAMHARTSGLADFLAADELDALRQARQVVAHLHWRRAGPCPGGAAATRRATIPRSCSGVAPADVRVPFDVREVLARVLDGSRFEEFKALYGSQLVCGWGELAGYPLGVLANNGILFSEEARKGSQFIALCNRTDTPLLFVQNITGFMVGTRYEQGGIIKDGAKLINAVSNSTVPHLTLMVGASYGAGNYAMAGRAYDPRFIFTWPNHRIAVMGPKQLAGVLSIVRRNAAAAAGRPFDETADTELTAATEAQIEAGVHGPFRHRPVVGRRDHRPPRHAYRALHRPGRRPLGAGPGHRRLRCGAPLMRRLLVANRAEIARRVLRAARAAGIETVAVFAEDDRSSPHVAEADRAVALGAGPPAATYLDVERVLGAARRAGADAVHPGYGFLSEDPRLGEGCVRAAGMVWVGPPPSAMATMGHKAQAKATVAAAGVPGPGWPGGRGSRRRPPRRALAEEVGYPLLVKASAGGGGRGMRLVEGPDELADSVAAARRARRPPRSAPTRCSWSATCPRPATSRSRWWPTATATWSTSSTGSARSNAATKRWWRRAPAVA